MTSGFVTLESDSQRLQLVPGLGGGIAAWDWKSGNGWMPLLRPWNGLAEDPYTLACFPLVPWSNRITQGGFEHAGVFHPIRPNRSGEPYPIHGDGWLQPWQVAAQNKDSIRLSLQSQRFDGNPYRYLAAQSFTLLPDGLAIDLSVTHLGEQPLPYGLGLHPYFVRNHATRLRSPASGIWLSGPDPIPVAHSGTFPPAWDYNQAAPLEGDLIDNCYTGWDGESVITYPDLGLSVTLTMAD